MSAWVREGRRRLWDTEFWRNARARSGRIRGLSGRLWALILSRVPEGYEDETGFHFGPDPRGAARRRGAKRY
jgi:hypothetical protein